MLASATSLFRSFFNYYISYSRSFSLASIYSSFIFIFRSFSVNNLFISVSYVNNLSLIAYNASCVSCY